MLDLIRQRAQSWGVKIAFGIIILVFVFWGVGNFNQAGPGVVAVVNGKPILMHDFREAMQRMEAEVRASAPHLTQDDMRAMQLPQQVLQMMISRALIAQEAERLGVTVTPVELFGSLRHSPAFQGPDGAFNQEVYEKAVTSRGMTVAGFEAGAMRDLLTEKMRSYVTSAVTLTPEEARRRFAFQMEKRDMSYVLFPTEEHRAGISVTAEEIAKYYEANQPRFAEPAMTAVRYVSVTPYALAPSMDVPQADVDAAFAQGPLRYKLRQIVLEIPSDADAAKEAEVRARLEAIAGEIRAGKDFADLAMEKSEDPTSVLGGELGWVQARQLSPQVLGALAGLDKGGVTAPVRLGAGYALLQLEESDPDWSQPEADIKAALRLSLAEEKAAIAFRDTQAQAEDMVALARPLDEIAREFKLSVRETRLTPREELAFVLGLSKPGQVSLFEGEKGSLVSAILETREGFVLAEISDQKPAGIQPLDEAKSVIEDLLIRREAEKKAEAAAREALARFASNVPAEYKTRITASGAFTRQGDIPGIGYAKALADAVFAAPLDQWMKEPYATPKGAVIAMPTAAIPLSDEEWAKIEGRVVPSLLEAKRNQVFTAYITDIGRKAQVSLPHPEIFQQH